MPQADPTLELQRALAERILVLDGAMGTTIRGYDLTEADARVFRGLDIPAAKTGNVVFCDGKDLMWYGARSTEGLGRLKALVDAARGGSLDC